MAHYPPQRIRAANAARTHASDFSVTTAPATLADAQAAVEAYGHQRSYMVHTLTFLLLTTLFVLAFGGRVAAKSLPRPTMLAPTCYTTATVLNSADSGAGSLRDAVNNVCAGGGTIEFAPGLSGQTIVLTSGELVPTADLTIDGATLTDPVTISGNDLSRIFNINSVTVTLNSLTLTHGNAVNENGGAIHIAGTAVVTITHSTIANSHATYAGGAVRLAPGTLTVLDTLFFSNTAGSLGGAISNNTGTVTIRNSTFTQNGAAGSGVITNLSDSTMTIDASTFNGATLFGKGINNRGTLHLRNTIIANMPNIGCDTDIGTVATNLNNLIEDGSCSATFRGDAHLGPLQDNGGPTLTHALLYNSPAIDQGESATCLATDQRGVSRPQAAGCDIGAYELVQPEIALLGDDLPISAGATSAAATNHTDFGTVIVGQSITHTFVISNSGPGDLALTNLPAVVITPATGFTLAATPTLTVAVTLTPRQDQLTPTPVTTPAPTDIAIYLPVVQR